MAKTDTARTIDPLQIAAYLQRRGFAAAEIISMVPLGAETQSELKAYGYGNPLLVTFASAGDTHRVVVRTMAPDPFGHDRRADRVDAMVQSFDQFGTIPRHIKALDVGAFESGGQLLSLPSGEPFLITEYVEGELYAGDLKRLSDRETADPLDLARADALARYLVALHQRQDGQQRYLRELRDTVGSGEGIFGLCDSYPPHPVATPERLLAIEVAALKWRWQLKGRSHRLSRTHGDFHPFNLLFRQGTDFSVLDCSRGGVGEPADDVTCLSINYYFFALCRHGRFDGPLRELWSVFWRTYLKESNDFEILEVVAPFFAWRGLVLASPVWYPAVSEAVREQLLAFVEGLLDGQFFDPNTMP